MDWTDVTEADIREADDGHLATLDGDLDDLTAEEARRVPACDATDCAVIWAMGGKLQARPTAGRRDSIVATVHGHPALGVSTKNTAHPSRGLRVSRDPRAAHEAREWLRKHHSEYLVGVDGEGEMREAVFISDEGRATTVSAPTEHLATARLILVLHAEDLL